MNARCCCGFTAALVFVVCPAVASAQVGVLDPVFGTEGRSTVPFNPDGVLDWSLAAIAVEPDGGIIVVGSAISSGMDTDFGVARLQPDGSLDDSFGVGGEQRIPFNLGAENTDQVAGVALQEDGKIVVAGSAQYSSSDFDFAVARLNSDGGLDGSFGVGGLATVWFDLGSTNYDAAGGVAVQPDGKIVLAGTASSASAGNYEFAVARLDPSGALDPSFSAGGKTTIAFDLGGLNSDSGDDVAIQSDGKIVVAGWAETGASVTDFAAVRLNEDGSPDPGFGTGGKVVIPFDLGGYLTDEALAVAIQNDGRIVLAGAAEYTENADHDFAIARLLPNGSLDASFGFGGKASVPFDMGGDLADIAYDVMIQADGKIVVAGTVASGADDTDFGVARLLPDGSLDPGFGTVDGRIVVPFDLGGPGELNFDDAYGAAIQGDHKVVVIGVVEEGANHDVLGVIRLTTDLIHLDGFDSGDTSAWSAAAP